MFKGRKNAPAWMKDVWKELTTPPHFVKLPSSHAEAPKEGSTPKKEDKNSGEQQAVSRGHPIIHADIQQAEGVSNMTKRNEKKQPRVKNRVKPLPSRRRAVRENAIDLKARKTLLSHGYPIELLDAYEWDVYRATKHENIIRLETDAGIFALKRAVISPKRIMFIHEALQSIREEGFLRYAPFLLTAEGDPYVQIERHVYYVTSWVNGRHVDFGNLTHVSEAAATLARLHEFSVGFSLAGYEPPDAFDIASRMKDRRKSLESIVEQVKNRARPNPVDEFVLEHADSYLSQAKEAIEIVSERECELFLDRESEKPGLCHLDVISQNMVVTKKGPVHLIDFDWMTHAPRVMDLGHMMRRAMHETNWSEDAALVSLVQYNSVRPLVNEEYYLLQALLTFPHRFWRVCERHYQHGGVPGTMEDLELLAEEEERREKFLDTFSKYITRRRRIR